MDAEAWDERYAAAGPAALVWSAGPNRFVAEHLAGLPPGRALDLAAGEGRNALWLAARGWSVTAVDFSAVAVDKGRAAQAEHPDGDRLALTWVVGDALTADLGSGLDLVLLSYLQLPVEELVAACRRGFGALRPGGTFFLVAHDSTNLTEGTGGPQDPAVLYTAEDVLAALDGERFEVEAADRVAREVRPSPDAEAAGEDAAAERTVDAHGAEPRRTAYDALVRLVRTG